MDKKMKEADNAVDKVKSELKSGEKIMCSGMVSSQTGAIIVLLISGGLFVFLGIIYMIPGLSEMPVAAAIICLVMGLLFWLGASNCIKGSKYQYCFATNNRVILVRKAKSDNPEIHEIHKDIIEKIVFDATRSGLAGRMKIDTLDPHTNKRKKYRFPAVLNAIDMEESIGSLKNR